MCVSTLRCATLISHTIVFLCHTGYEGQVVVDWGGDLMESYLVTDQYLNWTSDNVMLLVLFICCSDFKKGKRSKKLQSMLNSGRARSILERFQKHRQVTDCTI